MLLVVRFVIIIHHEICSRFYYFSFPMNVLLLEGKNNLGIMIDPCHVLVYYNVLGLLFINFLVNSTSIIIRSLTFNFRLIDFSKFS